MSQPSVRLSLGVSSSVVYCRACERETRWTLDGIENGALREFSYWRCFACGRRRMSMADAYDAANIPPLVVAEYLRRHGDGALDVVGGAEDADAHLAVELIVSWSKWKPERGVPFTAYATGMLRNRLHNLVRNTVGGYGGAAVRPLASALSLDAPLDGSGLEASGAGTKDGGLDEAPVERSRLEFALGGREGDAREVCDPDLAGAIAEGTLRASRRAAVAYPRPARGAPRRDRSAA